jgi:hypothetical protein
MVRCSDNSGVVFIADNRCCRSLHPLAVHQTGVWKMTVTGRVDCGPSRLLFVIQTTPWLCTTFPLLFPLAGKDGGSRRGNHVPPSSSCASSSWSSISLRVSQWLRECRFDSLSKAEDLAEAITYRRQALALHPPGHPDLAHLSITSRVLHELPPALLHGRLWCIVSPRRVCSRALKQTSKFGADLDMITTFCLLRCLASVYPNYSFLCSSSSLSTLSVTTFTRTCGLLPSRRTPL